MESIVKLCLSMCRSFSKMWSRSQILMLRSIEDVTTQLSVPTTNDLISTILWEKMGWTKAEPFEIFCKETPESEPPFFSPDHQSSCPSRAVLV